MSDAVLGTKDATVNNGFFYSQSVSSLIGEIVNRP